MTNSAPNVENFAGAPPLPPQPPTWWGAPSSAQSPPYGPTPPLAGVFPMGGDPWPEPVTAAQLCASPPVTPATLIADLIYQGGTGILSGPSKARKTFTLIGASLSVATGRPWLGFKTTAAPVIYLNLELQGFAMAKRVHEISKALGIPTPDNLHILNLRGHIVNIDQLTTNIGALIDKTQAKLVIIDPHYKLSSASGVEENSNDSQALLLYTIEKLCNSRDAAVMIGHHFAKGDAAMKRAIDRAAGGGTLARWPDVVMTLTDHKEPECMVVECALRNFRTPEPFVVRWKYPIWERDDSLDPGEFRPAGRNESHPASQALGVLGDASLRIRDWSERVGWTETTLRRKAKELLADGRVKLVGGLYSKT